MTQILADAAMVKQIAAANGPVHVVNDQGTVIGVLTPVASPYSPEELEARRKRLEPLREEARNHPERGKTLTEFWAEMEKRPGSQS